MGLRHNATSIHESLQVAQYHGMFNIEDSRKATTILSNANLGRHEHGSLNRAKAYVANLGCLNERQKATGVYQPVAHAASRLKNTMIDFDVGVSLSSLALPSGTNMFSSG